MQKWDPILKFFSSKLSLIEEKHEASELENNSL